MIFHAEIALFINQLQKMLVQSSYYGTVLHIAVEGTVLFGAQILPEHCFQGVETWLCGGKIYRITRKASVSHTHVTDST